MQSLRALGYDETIVNERHQGSEPSSGPGWSSILTGVWADKHGVDGNSFRKYFSTLPIMGARVPAIATDAIIHRSRVRS